MAADPATAGDRESNEAPLSTPNCSSTPTIEKFFVNPEDEVSYYEVVQDENDDEIPEEAAAEGDDDNQEDDDPAHPQKRKRYSRVWADLETPFETDGKWKTKCKHCNKPLCVPKTGTTSHLKRHLDKCLKKKASLKQQNMLNFMPSNVGVANSGFVSALHNGKLDMHSMREGIANWIVMHEKPFNIVEEEGFNMMLKRGIPQWTSVSRHTIRTDAFRGYETEKKNLKAYLKIIDKISLTTDLWRSKPQKIEYMVITGHYVDKD